MIAGPLIVLVKPPGKSRLNFGTFSLGVLAAAIRDQARIVILDATSLGPDAAAQAVWSHAPDFIGVTVMSLASVEPAAAFLAALRAAGPGRAPILVGGHGASMAPGPLLAAGADAVVFGEGEQTLQAVLDAGLQPGMPGLACLVDGERVAGPRRRPIRPLDSLQPPARDLMPSPPDGVHLLETSRGCPHACAFCEVTLFNGRQWRPHSPGRVAAEVRRLVDDYGAWVLHFADDNFAASPRRVLDICARLRRGPQPALIIASARGDDLLADERLIPALASARILRVSVGVETVEPGVAAAVAKPISIETYQEAFARLRAHGIFSVASFIVGLPGETPDMRARAVERAVEAGPDAARFLPFLPLPGTPLAGELGCGEPSAEDARDAQAFTRAFARHPQVRARLAAAAEAGDIRGQLAAATLRRMNT